MCTGCETHPGLKEPRVEWKRQRESSTGTEQTILPTQVSSSAGREQMRAACREGGFWH